MRQSRYLIGKTMNESVKWNLVRTWELLELRRAAGVVARKGEKHFVHIPVSGTAYRIEGREEPQHAYVSEMEYEATVALRVLDQSQLPKIGEFMVQNVDAAPRRYVAPVYFDGEDTFFWPADRTETFADFKIDSANKIVAYIDNLMRSTVHTVGTCFEDYSVFREKVENLSGIYQLGTAESGAVFIGSHAPQFRPRFRTYQGFTLLDDYALVPSKVVDWLGSEPESLFELATRLEIYEGAVACDLIAEHTQMHGFPKTYYKKSDHFDWYENYLSQKGVFGRPSDLAPFMRKLFRDALKMVGKDDPLVKQASEVMKAEHDLVPSSFRQDDKVVPYLDSLEDFCKEVLQSRPEIENRLRSEESWKMKTGPFEIMRLRAKNLKKLMPQPGLAPRI